MKVTAKMMNMKCMVLVMVAGMLTACGGGGGGTGAGGGGGGTTAAAPISDPTAPGTNNTYRSITATSGSSPLTGAILAGGSSVTGTTGTITHSDGTFTATGVSGATDLDDSSAFDLPSFTFATDVALSSGAVAIVGVGTLPEDVRTTGTAAYTGTFVAQLVDSSLGPTATTLNWDADIQVDFAGNGDVDLTFEGGGSDLIDTIRISNATIDGATFSGGTLRTSKDGSNNNITGTSVNMAGAFFGYNGSLLLPGEAGGAIQSSDGDTDISGVFLTQAAP